MSLERLPLEILGNILKHVEKEDQYNCILLNGVLHTLVKPIYYSELDIDDETLERLLREMPVEEDVVPFKYLSLTRKLRVYKPEKRYMGDTNDSSRLLTSWRFLEF